MKSRQQLPANYALIVVEMEGRFYPMRTDEQTEQGTIQLSWSPHLTWDFEAGYGIPPALGPRHTCGVVSFARHAQAVEYCHRYHENSHLLFQYCENLLGTADYPERNVWYLEEIKACTRSNVYLYTCFSFVSASTFLRDGTHCAVRTTSLDEAIVQLYEVVSEKAQQLQAQPA